MFPADDALASAFSAIASSKLMFAPLEAFNLGCLTFPFTVIFAPDEALQLALLAFKSSEIRAPLEAKIVIFWAYN